mgnify:CR=1 FL=1
MAADQDNNDLASWVMERVQTWEDHRKANYDSKWDEYYRLWRGLWTDNDQNRYGERSKIICPELSQAIETCVAELEDATFIRDRWIDVHPQVEMPPGKQPGNPDEAKTLETYISALLDDFDCYGVTQGISETYLNGALYGTGIAKIVVEKVTEPVISEDPNLPSIEFKDVYRVKLVPIAPRNFVIDPSAHSIDDALGCAHVITVPLSVVQKRISNGTYKSIPLNSYSSSVDDLHALAEFEGTKSSEYCKIVEYHGLVPKRFISNDKLFEDDGLDAALAADALDTAVKAVGGVDSKEEMIEALVTVINDEYVAKAVQNPFLFGDRSIVAYQHETVPNRFWGRGVAEKGYNPQKALDAEIRARIDALGLSTHPMMGIDATRLPRGANFDVRPGRSILCQGNPAEVLMPLKFPPPDPQTFNQTQELREMIQRATGGYELPAMMNDANRMAATSMSMVVGSMIKRSRRTLANINREFLNPLVKKALYRYMQFDSERFPLKDYKFRIRTTMGIMAREFEQGQQIALLSTVPQESPAYWMLIKSIYENSNSENREQMIEFADKFLQSAMNPQPPPPDPKVKVETLRLAFEEKKHKNDLDIETRKLQQEDQRIQIAKDKEESAKKIDEAMAFMEIVRGEIEKQSAQVKNFVDIIQAQAASITAEANAIKATQTKNVDGSVSQGAIPESELGELLKEALPILKSLTGKNKLPIDIEEPK